jgi:glycosyltransferase involved in cell wall biosynthesis
MQPRISVVLPAFNGEAFVADAIECVREQTQEALEIVVVDDGSTDSTAAIVRQLGGNVHYVHRRQGGPAAARNLGVAMAKGDLIAFIDQDDLWPEDHLAVLVEAMDRRTASVSMGLTRALVLDNQNSPAGRFVPYGAPWRAPQVGSALFSRASFDAVGPFNEQLEYCSDDLDWFMRARELGIRIAEIDRVTLLFRIHGNNTSRDAEFRRRALLEAVTASVRRRLELHR